MRRRARLLPLLAGLATLLAVAAGLSPAAVSAQEPGPTGPAPTLELVSRPPWARPVDELPFTLAITGDPATTTVQVEVFSALDSVEELEESATEDVGVRLSRTTPTPVAELAPGPGGSRVVTLPVAAEPVDDVTTQLVEPGVHPVVISLLGPGGEVLDEVRTPLVRLGDPDDPWAAPDLAVLLDVDASPTLAPDGTRSLPATAVRRLAHVGEILATHPELDLSVAAVPDTVEALAEVDDPMAAALLEQLAGRDLLRAPYVPLPVEELVEEGLEGLIVALVDRGAAVLTDRLDADLRSDVWTGEHAVGEDGGRILGELGFDRVVVPAPEEEVEDDSELAALADSGPRPVLGAGPLLGLVADPVLSAELASPLADRPDAAHEVLARYLLRPAEEDPAGTTDDGDDEGPQATVLVRPGRLAEDSQLAGLLDLLDDPAAPVRVGGLDLVDDEPDVADPDDGGDGDVEPVAWSAEPGPELDAIADRVLALAGRLESFAAMVAERSSVADDLRLQVATAVAADTDPAARTAAIDVVERTLDAGFDAVRLSGQTDLNLTSRRGTLPVTVENANPYAVDVLLRVRSERLAFPDGDVLPLTVAEGEQLRVDIPVEARATGSVPVFVELLSPDDRTVLGTRRLNVRSTAVSGVGLVISAGAILVLLTWWIRHTLHVRRSRGSDGADRTMG